MTYKKKLILDSETGAFFSMSDENVYSVERSSNIDLFPVAISFLVIGKRRRDSKSPSNGH